MDFIFLYKKCRLNKNAYFSEQMKSFWNQNDHCCVWKGFSDKVTCFKTTFMMIIRLPEKVSILENSKIVEFDPF